MAKVTCTNIKWDTDGNKEVFDNLPQTVEVEVENPNDDDEISDALSDKVGYCHFGFSTEHNSNTDKAYAPFALDANYDNNAEIESVAIESLVIEGEADNDNQMSVSNTNKGFHAPFALFSPDLQTNVAGPYATRSHAVAALKAMKQGKIVPYTDESVVWTVEGKPSVWYEKD